MMIVTIAGKKLFLMFRFIFERDVMFGRDLDQTPFVTNLANLSHLSRFGNIFISSESKCDFEVVDHLF